MAEHINKLPNIPVEISESTIKKGLSLIDYFIPHARMAFDSMEVNEEIEDAYYLWSKLELLHEIHKRECFSKNELRRAARGRLDTLKLDNAIQILIERNYIKLLVDRNGEAGRNTIFIYLNPMALMAKIATDDMKDSSEIDYSHYSHDIQHLEKETFEISEDSIEAEDMDIYL